MSDKIALPLQKTLLALNAVLLGYLGLGYFNGASANHFPVLENLFKPEMVELCTASGCWQSIVPFLGSTYMSLMFISVLALFFRATTELRLVIVGLASVHIVMVAVRLLVVPTEFYQEGTALQASASQFIVGLVLLASTFLPYPKRMFE